MWKRFLKIVAIFGDQIYYLAALYEQQERTVEMIVDYSVIGKRIQRIRKQNRLSRSQLSSMVGISSGHLGHIETGSKSPSVEILICIAISLDVSVDALLVDLNLPKKGNTEMIELLKNCTPGEKDILEELIVAMKGSPRSLHLSKEVEVGTQLVPA